MTARVRLNGILPVGGLLIVCFLVSVCGGRGDPPSEPPDRTTETPPAAASVPVVAEEIVPVLAPLSSPIAEDRVLPEDPVAFRKEVQAALKTEPSARVLPMLDVLLVINPDDHEMRERRGMLLLKEGRLEDGAVDLRICCAGGRHSCCR